MSRRLFFAAVVILTMPLLAMQTTATALSHDAFQLLPTAASITRHFVVDQTSLLTVDVVSTSRSLVVALIGPNGGLHTIGGTDTANVKSEVVNTDGGASYVASITNPVAGSWSLTVRSASPVTSAIDVVSTVYFNNATRFVILGGGNTYPLGSNVRFAVVAFDGTKILKGVAINARWFRPGDATFTPIAVTFHDDGKEGDEVAGDGIFEAVISPAVAGTYQLQADVTGTASTGSFARTAGATFTFRRHRAQITGFTSRTVDADGDSLFDRLIITPSATVTDAGKFLVHVRLRGSNGHELESSIETSLQVGNNTSDVTFNASDIARVLAVDGPYTLSDVRYEAEIPSDIVVVDDRTDLGMTPPYTLAQFQHPSLRLDTSGSTVSLLTNNHNLITQITVGLQLTADVAGKYTWSASLVDYNGKEIDFTIGTVDLLRGTSIVGISFQGSKIGLHGTDGPYYVTDFAVYDGTRSLYVENAFETPAYAVRMFDGYAPPRHRAVRH